MSLRWGARCHLDPLGGGGCMRSPDHSPKQLVPIFLHYSSYAPVRGCFTLILGYEVFSFLKTVIWLKCRTAKKKSAIPLLCYLINLMLDSLSCSFTSISFFTILLKNLMKVVPYMKKSSCPMVYDCPVRMSWDLTLISFRSSKYIYYNKQLNNISVLSKICNYLKGY